jgi:hypothetical protein
MTFSHYPQPIRRYKPEQINFGDLGVVFKLEYSEPRKSVENNFVSSSHSLKKVLLSDQLLERMPLVL